MPKRQGPGGILATRGRHGRREIGWRGSGRDGRGGARGGGRTRRFGRGWGVSLGGGRVRSRGGGEARFELGEAAEDAVETAPERAGLGEAARVAAEGEGDVEADFGDEESDIAREGIRQIGGEAWRGSGGGRGIHDLIPRATCEPLQENSSASRRKFLGATAFPPGRRAPASGGRPRCGRG